MSPVGNLARLRAMMTEHDLAAMIASARVNVYYLSGYHSWIEGALREWMVKPGGSDRFVSSAFVLVPAQAPPALVIGGAFAPDALGSWVEDVWVYGAELSIGPGHGPALPARLKEIYQGHPIRNTAVEALAAAVRNRGLATSRLGVDRSGIASENFAALQEALPSTSLADCTTLLRLTRMIKTSDEIVALARAAEINEEAAGEVAKAARDGCTTADLANVFTRSVVTGGAAVDHVTCSACGIGSTSSGTYTPRQGESVAVDTGCVYKGYFADTAFTISLGEPPAALARQHAVLRDCVLEAGLEHSRGGTRVSTVHRAMQEFAATYGALPANSLGHGIGVEARDYPIITDVGGLRVRDDCVDVSADFELEAGMVLNLEAASFVAGLGATQVEVTVLVEENGARLLISQDRTRPRRGGG
jgi:Xaa-Pro dipeptidase